MCLRSIRQSINKYITNTIKKSSTHPRKASFWYALYVSGMGTVNFRSTHVKLDHLKCCIKFQFASITTYNYLPTNLQCKLLHTWKNVSTPFTSSILFFCLPSTFNPFGASSFQKSSPATLLTIDNSCHIRKFNLRCFPPIGYSC